MPRMGCSPQAGDMPEQVSASRQAAEPPYCKKRIK